MWVLFITWDDFDMGRYGSQMPTNTVYVCEDEEDVKLQYNNAMSPHWNDVAYAQICFFPELAKN